MEIRLEKFCKSFGSVKVIEDLDLIINNGEMIALLGPSGCGKTTTLYAICGIHRVISGAIWFGDKDVTALPPQKKNVGVVFQSFALYPHLSIYENIAFPLRIRKEGSADIERKINEIAGVLHMEALLDRRPGQLSGGQQQRVALARALVRKPDVLLMDEPLANLDAGLRLEMRSEIRRIQQETGCTSILVTHDQVEAMSMCDRIALMNEGKIQQVGSPDEMYHQPRNRFVAGFIGNPPISFTEGKIEDGHFNAPGLRFELPDRIKASSVTPGQNFSIGIRPEHLLPDFATPIEGEITFVESQGRETLYDLRLAGGQIFRSIQTGQQTCKLGDQIRWGIDVDSIFFFDEHGLRI
jgi:inositol-phosphate transport system ATP-binding protein|tara:strand:+ start:783 stop:1841 length:1059 start_codon:yes stop_codon:yes gene_type:complete